ncbi:MAG: hypothetical protein GF388_07520, partial [Candidatus Aegiribacteria sp.]|nr:hypothetical protein [Candidatus Aegiribacteria sp.]MBD3294973.1 hypothetical protein [Candidatus Fermentibacteria bacterium]
FMGEKARPLQGALTGLFLALVHAGSAVAVVGLFYLLAKGPLLVSVDRVETVLVPFASGLLVLLGVWMVFRGIAEYRRKGTEDGKNTGRWGIIASGMFPCPGAAAVMLFAAAMDAFLLGVVAVAAMSAGMALILAGVGTASVMARGKLLKFMGSDGKGRMLELLLHLAGGGLVLVMGLFLLLASLPA